MNRKFFGALVLCIALPALAQEERDTQPPSSAKLSDAQMKMLKKQQEAIGKSHPHSQQGTSAELIKKMTDNYSKYSSPKAKMPCSDQCKMMKDVGGAQCEAMAESTQKRVCIAHGKVTADACEKSCKAKGEIDPEIMSTAMKNATKGMKIEGTGEQGRGPGSGGGAPSGGGDGD